MTSFDNFNNPQGFLQKKIAERDVITEMSLLPAFPKKRLAVEVTNMCNHTCLFCPHDGKMTRGKGFIDEQLLKRILKEGYELGSREVGLNLNGEPLLVKELAEYIKYAKDIGYSYVFLISNGVLATEERMIDILNAGLDSISFSINAGTKETYKIIHGVDDFEKVKNNILFCLRYRFEKKIKIAISLTYVVTEYNINEIDIFKKQFSSIVDDIVFSQVKDIGGYIPEINNMINSDVLKVPLQHENCVWPFNGVVVTWEGYLTICCWDWQNYLAVADLNKVSLHDAWYGENMQKLRQRFIDDNFEGTICQLCKNRKFIKPEPLVNDLYSNYNFK
jgi:sulfatase maturation enzyme AslB (radical SAM superfamily)